MKIRIASVSLICLLVVCGCQTQSKNEAKTGVTPAKGTKPSRVAVKHGLDPTAKLINRAVKNITIEELNKMERPEGLGDDISTSDFQDKRIEPLETQIWRVKGKVKSIIKRRDGDYFLTLESPSGATTVVEVPDPSLCSGSPIETEITASRKDLEAKFHPTDKSQEVNQEATVEGVGFWGQKGKKGGNGARLMPGTSVQFKK